MQAVGNLYDKYGTKNPIARRLMRGFLGTVLDLSRMAAPRRVLEVGCGEGHLTQFLFERLLPERFDACDLGLERLTPHRDPRIEFRQASAYELPYADASFDLVLCCEVLEHLTEPQRAVRELERVTASSVIVSTPFEPLFRTMNLLRGAYLPALGNTPGHVQHFGPRTLRQLVSSALDVRRVCTPLPWVVVLAERRRHI
ncbi:MAG TPA: class I SAM-dependent methyltransferase [Polyangiaceae bacterium]